MSNPNCQCIIAEIKSIPDEERNRYLWETLYKLRKKLRFAERENAYLKKILDICYEPEKLRLALAKYREWRDTELQSNA